MSVSSTSANRKARRKEEREAKKQKKRAAHNHGKVGTSVDDHTDNKAKAEVPSKKRQAATAEGKPERSPGKKARRSTTAVVSRNHDPYANLPPEVAAAMRRDDEEIADLEVKLGLTRNVQDERLNGEYSKNDCFGEDFGKFLYGLDEMCKQILTHPPQEFSEDEDNCSDGEDTSDSENVEKEAAE